eukprot:3455823-Alexandrium_andersonii.AAC.1
MSARTGASCKTCSSIPANSSAVAFCSGGTEDESSLSESAAAALASTGVSVTTPRLASTGASAALS